MADISNLKINERANVWTAEFMTVTTIENEIYIKGQYENRQNFKWCEISNGRKIY